MSLLKSSIPRVPTKVEAMPACWTINYLNQTEDHQTRVVLLDLKAKMKDFYAVGSSIGTARNLGLLGFDSSELRDRKYLERDEDGDEDEFEHA